MGDGYQVHLAARTDYTAYNMDTAGTLSVSSLGSEDGQRRIC